MTSKTVKNLTLIVGIVALASALGMAQDSQAAMQQSLTGTVKCEGQITHQYTCQRNQTQQSCTLACAQRGYKLVLLVGDKVYQLEGNNQQLEAYAGGKATVTGVAMNDQIEVETASSAQHLPSSMGANSSR